MLTPVTATARRFARWEFLPEAVLLAGLTVFFVDQTDAATSAFKSSKALAIMAAATAGWVAARMVLARILPFAFGRAAVFSVAAAVALSAVVFPAYDNETVVESFPVAAAAAPDDVPLEAAVPDTTPAPAPLPPSDSAPEPAPRPATPSTTTAATPTTATTAPQAAEAPGPPPRPTTTTAGPGTVAAPPAPAEPAVTASGPERLRSGPIRGIDHRASGTAAIYRQPDGRYVVGLEDIDIQPGPDYDLYVVPGEEREDTRGGIRLGDLRGNKGTQFYEVPEGVDLENGPWTVLVWCQTFAVPVAGATPS